MKIQLFGVIENVYVLFGLSIVGQTELFVGQTKYIHSLCFFGLSIVGRFEIFVGQAKKIQFSCCFLVLALSGTLNSLSGKLRSMNQC